MGLAYAEVVQKDFVVGRPEGYLDGDLRQGIVEGIEKDFCHYNQVVSNHVLELEKHFDGKVAVVNDSYLNHQALAFVENAYC